MDNRHVIGVYDSSEEVINEFENDNRPTQSAAGFSVIGEDKSEVERVSDELGVDIEPLNNDENKQGSGFLDKVTSAFKGEHETPVEDTLKEMGVPEDEAHQYAPELEQGKMLVVGDPELAANGNTDVNAGTPPTTGADTEWNRNGEEERDIQLREEQLDLDKKEVEAGDVEIEKDVVEDTETVNVPVSREEVYVKKRPVHDEESAEVNANSLKEDEEYHIPVMKEEVEVRKKPVVSDEVVVGKREVEDEEQVRENVKHEELHVQGEGNLEVDEDDNVFNDSVNSKYDGNNKYDK